MKQLLTLIILIVFVNCISHSDIQFQINENSRPCYGKDYNTILFSAIVNNKNRIILYNKNKDQYKAFNRLTTNNYEPIFSYNYKKIAFVQTNKEKTYSEIYVMNSDGSNILQVTKARQHSRTPFFSPDGKKIYFIRTMVSGSTQVRTGFWLYSINIDGTGEKRVSKPYYYIYNPVCSPNGKYIFYTHDYKSSKYNHDMQKLVKLDLETNNLKVILDETVYLRATISRNGKKIIYCASNSTYDMQREKNPLLDRLPEIHGIYSADINGSNSQLLYKLGFVNDITTSSDSKKYMFYFSPSSIMEINSDGTNFHKIDIDKDKILALFKNS